MFFNQKVILRVVGIGLIFLSVRYFGLIEDILYALLVFVLFRVIYVAGSNSVVTLFLEKRLSLVFGYERLELFKYALINSFDRSSRVILDTKFKVCRLLLESVLRTSFVFNFIKNYSDHYIRGILVTSQCIGNVVPFSLVGIASLSHSRKQLLLDEYKAWVLGAQHSNSGLEDNLPSMFTRTAEIIVDGFGS